MKGHFVVASNLTFSFQNAEAFSLKAHQEKMLYLLRGPHFIMCSFLLWRTYFYGPWINSSKPYIRENEYFFCPDSRYLRWEEKKLLEFVRENDSTVFFFFPLFWLANHSLAFTYFLQMTLTTRCRRQHFLIKAQSTIIARAAFGAYPDNDSSVSYHQKIALEYQKKKKNTDKPKNLNRCLFQLIELSIKKKPLYLKGASVLSICF